MSSVVVVDTSVAIKWVIPEPDSATADALVQTWKTQGTTLIAPPLFAYEVANTLHQQVRKGKISLDEARKSLSQLLDPNQGPVLMFSPDPAINLALSMRALELAQQHGLPATYDAHYLALAEREGCEYWTADERLWNAVKVRLPWVRWLGELSAPTAAPPPPPPAAP